MADEKKPDPPATAPVAPSLHATANPTPSVAPVGAPPVGVVYVASPPPHVPPKPNVTPAGGKFGIVKVDFKDGERVETIEYVNAFGEEFIDDPKNPERNLRPRPSAVMTRETR